MKISLTESSLIGKEINEPYYYILLFDGQFLFSKQE